MNSMQIFISRIYIARNCSCQLAGARNFCVGVLCMIIENIIGRGLLKATCYFARLFCLIFFNVESAKKKSTPIIGLAICYENMCESESIIDRPCKKIRF